MQTLMGHCGGLGVFSELYTYYFVGILLNHIQENFHITIIISMKIATSDHALYVTELISFKEHI